MMNLKSEKKKCSAMPSMLIKHAGIPECNISILLLNIRIWKEKPCMTDYAIVPQSDYDEVCFLPLMSPK